MTDTSAPTTAATERHMDTWTMAGLAFVVLAGLSAAGYGQFNTGTAAGYPKFLAWVLPLSTDAAGLVTARVWMLAPRGSNVRDYAAGLTIFAVALSAFSSVLHLLLPSGETVPQLPAGGCIEGWELTSTGDCVAVVSPAMHTLLIVVKILTGAIPSVMVGLMIHLLALWVTAPARRTRKTTRTSTPATATSSAPATATTATATDSAKPQPPAATGEPGEPERRVKAKPSWSPEQFEIAVRVVRQGNGSASLNAVVAALQAEGKGISRATAGQLRNEAIGHVNTPTTNNTTNNSTVPATAGKE